MSVQIMPRAPEPKKQSDLDKFSQIASIAGPIASVIPGGQALGAGLQVASKAGAINRAVGGGQKQEQFASTVPTGESAMSRRLSTLNMRQNEDPINILQQGQQAVTSLNLPQQDKEAIFQDFLAAEKQATLKKRGFA